MDATGDASQIGRNREESADEIKSNNENEEDDEDELVVNHEPHHVVGREIDQEVNENTPECSDREDEVPNLPSTPRPPKHKTHKKSKHFLSPKQLKFDEIKKPERKKKRRNVILSVEGDRFGEITERGVWVQCCDGTCNKWRYLPHIHDPSLIPEYWVCSMNEDKTYDSCSIAEVAYDERKHEEDMIYTRFTEGSVVWARLAGYPWWPAMIEVDPDTEQSVWILDNDPMTVTHYHVVYFSKDVSRSWLGAKHIKLYRLDDKPPQTVVKGHNYRKQLEVARLSANDALLLTLKERIAKFGFRARFNGKWPSVKEDKSDDKKTKLKKKVNMRDDRDDDDDVKDSSPNVYTKRKSQQIARKRLGVYHDDSSDADELDDIVGSAKELLEDVDSLIEVLQETGSDSDSVKEKVERLKVEGKKILKLHKKKLKAQAVKQIDSRKSKTSKVLVDNGRVTVGIQELSIDEVRKTTKKRKSDGTEVNHTKVSKIDLVDQKNKAKKVKLSEGDADAVSNGGVKVPVFGDKKQKKPKKERTSGMVSTHDAKRKNNVKITSDVTSDCDKFEDVANKISNEFFKDADCDELLSAAEIAAVVNSLDEDIAAGEKLLAECCGDNETEGAQLNNRKNKRTKKDKEKMSKVKVKNVEKLEVNNAVGHECGFTDKIDRKRKKSSKKKCGVVESVLPVEPDDSTKEVKKRSKASKKSKKGIGLVAATMATAVPVVGVQMTEQLEKSKKGIGLVAATMATPVPVVGVQMTEQLETGEKSLDDGNRERQKVKKKSKKFSAPVVGSKEELEEVRSKHFEDEYLLATKVTDQENDVCLKKPKTKNKTRGSLKNVHSGAKTSKTRCDSQQEILDKKERTADESDEINNEELNCHNKELANKDDELELDITFDQILSQDKPSSSQSSEPFEMEE